MAPVIVLLSIASVPDHCSLWYFSLKSHDLNSLGMYFFLLGIIFRSRLGLSVSLRLKFPDLSQSVHMYAFLIKPPVGSDQDISNSVVPHKKEE